MDKKHLQYKILEAPYKREVWIEVLKEYFGVRKIHINPQQIIIDKSKAKYAVELGSFETNDEKIVGIFEIELKPNVKIERNRVGLRSLLRQVYKYDVDGALIVFVQDDKWRFSYVSDIRTEEGKKETASKRYTYLLGKNEKALTAAIRFERLLKKQQENNFQLLSLNDFEEAFSVEKLSKEFFNSYKDIYEDFVQFLTGKRYTKQGNKYAEAVIREPNIQLNTLFNKDEKQARDFCKRMMGRIVFLYFIQKKGWLAVTQGQIWGKGNPDYLFDMFNKSKHQDDFYNQELVPLFFKTLNDPNSENEKNILRFPYLNGGLFDDSHDKKYNNLQLPQNIFKNLFETFNNFNFTIYEDAPDEHTVAVDPEMLGHIFENLLEDNKDKGAFYTPKEIVHYMCKESLKAYLLTHEELLLPDSEIAKSTIEKLIQQIELNEEETNFAEKNAFKIMDALEQVKICDPAIGSGAFPMGLLQEIFNVQIYLQDLKGFRKRISDADIKKHIIEESICGVDIDAGAVDIARLRFWLSLVVDELVPQPLPNLDFKIVCANTLIPTGYDKFIELAEKTQTPTLLRMDGEIQKLQAIRDKYFDEVNREQKEILKKAFITTRDYILNEFKGLKKTWNLGDFIDKIAEWQPFEDNSCSWFDAWWMFGIKDGFDIVIGNPPYVQLQKDGGRLAKMFDKYDYETFERTGDIYSLFYERGVKLLKEKGVLCYITSNKWMRANYGTSTRQFFAEQTYPLLLIDFGNIQVFETATVDTNILLLQNKPKARKYESKELFAVRFTNDFSLAEHSIGDFVKQNGYFLTALNQNSWVVGEKDIYNVKDYISIQGLQLNRWDISIDYGIKTGYNKAFIIPTVIRNKIISDDRRSDEIIKPILRGKDISAWFAEFDDYWIIGTFPSKKLNIDDYPAIKKHLLTNGRERLEQDGIGRKKTGNKWFETQDQISYWEKFECPKIIFPNMTKYLPFVYDDSRLYTNQKCFIVTGERLKYLTCFFNSKLFKYCFADNFPELQGGTRELSKVFFDKIPVKQISEKEEIPFAKIVDYLIAFKKEKSTENTDQFMFIYFEQIANALVFELYFKEEFEKRNLEIAKYIKDLPNLSSTEKTLHELRKIYVSINQQQHPLKQSMFSMLSIPQIELVINSD